MFKTKLVIRVLKVMKWISNIFALLGVLGSFILLVKTNFLLNEQGRQALYINKLFYIILIFSLLPASIYILSGYITRWTMKNNFKIIQKIIFNNISTIAFLLITHYVTIIFTFIGVCIAHTHYIWLISIPVLLFIYVSDLLAISCLKILKN